MLESASLASGPGSGLTRLPATYSSLPPSFSLLIPRAVVISMHSVKYIFQSQGFESTQRVPFPVVQSSWVFTKDTSLHCRQITTSGVSERAVLSLPKLWAVHPWPCVCDSIMDELLIMIYHQDKGNLQVILSKDKDTKACA